MNLDEIDFYNIGSWPKALKLAVIIGTLALIAIIINWLFISSKVEQLENLLVEEKRLRTFFINKHKMLVNISEYKNQMTEIQQRLSTLVQLLPSANEIPTLVNQVSLAGKDSGLSFKEISILPEKDFKYYVELPIKIKVTGSYHQLGEFVSKVSVLPRIITLHDLTLAPDKVKVANQTILRSNDNLETLELEVLAKTYRYLQQDNQDNIESKGRVDGKVELQSGASRVPAPSVDRLNKPAAGG